MKPQLIVKKKSFWQGVSPKPTKNTTIVGENIVFSHYLSIYATIRKIKVDEKFIISALDELRKATDIVEKGEPYYKEH